MSALVYLGWTAEAAELHTKRARTEGGHRERAVGGRSLASISPVTARMGQGEQMLYRTTKSSPSFIKQAGPQKDAVRVAGVCRDAYGALYTASDKNYVGCIDSATHSSSGATVNDYFGSAQRQAGASVGVRLGE